MWGICFRFPSVADEDHSDVCWDDDYDLMPGFRAWLWKKYAGSIQFFWRMSATSFVFVRNAMPTVPSTACSSLHLALKFTQPGFRPFALCRARQTKRRIWSSRLPGQILSFLKHFPFSAQGNAINLKFVRGSDVFIASAISKVDSIALQPGCYISLRNIAS